MRNGQKRCAAVLAALVFCLTAAHAEGAYGAAAVEEGRTYTLAEMLTYAIQDEYLARARYSSDIAKFGQQPPFSRIVEAEGMHVAHLQPLFERYSLPLPEDKAADYVTVPDTFEEALRSAQAGEQANMRMYGIFLERQLPDDVRAVFSVLRQAAGNHYRAFSRSLERLEGGSAARVANGANYWRKNS